MQFLNTSKHKVGADRIESFNAIPVDNGNRLREIGPPKQIEVHPSTLV
jgi:hypothetical protein